MKDPKEGKRREGVGDGGGWWPSAGMLDLSCGRRRSECGMKPRESRKKRKNNRPRLARQRVAKSRRKGIIKASVVVIEVANREYFLVGGGCHGGGSAACPLSIIFSANYNYLS